MSIEDDYRDVFDDRYERCKEMFWGDPEVTEKDIRAAAASEAKRLSGSNGVPAQGD